VGTAFGLSRPVAFFKTHAVISQSATASAAKSEVWVLYESLRTHPKA